MGKRSLSGRELVTLKIKIESDLKELNCMNDSISDEFDIMKNENCSDVLDCASSTVLNAHKLRFRNREIFYARKLKSALEKIKKDEYGLCDVCSGPIGYRRLFARPTAILCISCKEDSERSKFLYVGSDENSEMGL